MIDWPLTPPTQLTLIISLLAAIFACLVHWLHLAVPPLAGGSKGSREDQRTDLAVAGTTISSLWPGAFRQAD